MSSSKSRVHHARILAGTAFVNSGQGITDLVIPLLIVARTGRSFDFCIAFAIQQIPTLSLLPLVGAWLGRRNCRLVLAGSVLVRCAAIGVIGRTAVTGFDLEVLSLALFVLGICDVVYETGVISLTGLFTVEGVVGV